MAQPVKKYSIKEVDVLITSINSLSGETEEAICKALGYNEGYISQLRSREKAEEEPQVSPKFYKTLSEYHKRTLQNANGNPPPPSDNGQKVVLDLSVLLGLLRSAQSENGRLLDVIDANLTTLASTQQIILAHVKAGHRWEAKKYGGGAEAEEKSILVQLNKFADEYLPDGEPRDKNVQGRK